MIKKNYGGCIEACTKAIAAQPSHPVFLDMRAECYIRNKENEKATKDLDEAIKIGTDYYGDNYRSLAALYRAVSWRFSCGIASSDKKRTIDYALKALELMNKVEGRSPRDMIDYYATLAAAYARNGQYNVAVENQQKAIDECKKDTNLEQHQKENALTQLNKKLSLYQNKTPYTYID